MDIIKYKGENTLLLDTDDFLTENARIYTDGYLTKKELNRTINGVKIKHILVITSMPITSLPLWLRKIMEKGKLDFPKCYRVDP